MQAQIKYWNKHDIKENAHTFQTSKAIGNNIAG